MNPMQTAAPIARVRAAEGDRPGTPLFSDPYARLFDDGANEAEAIFLQLPFFTEHIRLRTRYFDDAVRRALAAGVRDIVLVGAGFDCRGLRMPEIEGSGARVVEVDHGAQLGEKRRRLDAAGVKVPVNVVAAPADLAVPGELERALAVAGVVAGARALWVCEGLFGYLGRDDMQSLADVTARCSGPGSSIVGNHGTSSWNPESLARIFAGAGWQVTAAPSFEALHREHLGPEVPPGSDAFALLEATI